MSALKYVNKLQNKRVLVLGGSTGVGFCVAEAALEHGAIVIISSSSQSKLDNAVSRLREHIKAANLGDAEKILFAKTCDLSNPKTIDENVIDLLEFASKGGKLDHVVFTAGDAVAIKNVKEITVEDIHAVGQVRTVGTLILAKHLDKYINQSVTSSLTLTSGTNSWRPLPNWSLVGGAGSTAENLARTLAVDLRPVRVNAVQLGGVFTELFKNFPPEALEGFKAMLRAQSVTGTVGTPQEVAEAYIYTMKDSYATGGVIETNGGRLVGETKQ